MTYYSTPLTTLDDVITQSRLQDANVIDPNATVQTTIDTADANTKLYLKTLLNGVSDLMQKRYKRSLTPYLETKTFNQEYLVDDGFFYDRNLGQRIMVMDNVGGDDCLNISSFDWNGTALTSSDYRFRYPNVSPNYELTFNPNTSFDSLAWNENVSIIGIWGYHNSYNDMWVDSGDTVLDSPLSASATSITVTDADTFDTYQLIRIESEYLFITELNTTTNILTVERGKNGTTAASHVATTQIDTFVPMPAIAKECRRLVLRAWFLRNPVTNVVVSNAQIKELIEGEIDMTILPRRLRMQSV